MSAVTVRFPASLHERIKKLAEQEGISMNQFVLLATAEKTAAMDVRAQMETLHARSRRAEDQAARAGASPADLMRELLDRAPDVEPLPEDRLPEGE